MFDSAAAPEKWAVSGAFAFAGVAPNSLTGKSRQAFANGFLGLPSFGRSTLATVTHATATNLDRIEQILTLHFMSARRAPDEAAARCVAVEETSFVRELCRDAPINTCFTVRRTWDPEGQIKEEIRIVRSPMDQPLHADGGR